MELNILLTGLKVHDYTIEAIRTIRQHNPEVDIIWINAGRDSPEPMKHCRVIHTPGASLTESYNFGILQNPAKWHLMVNDDVICYDKISVDGLSERTLYGPNMAKGNKNVGGREFIGAWVLFLSHSAWEEGVQYDNKIKECAWEDFDICMQAKAIGYSLVSKPSLFPFEHLNKSGRVISSDIWKENLEYVKKKWRI